MTAKWNIGLSLAAGLMGGAITHWAFPSSVWAQAKPPVVIRAERYDLIDPNGKVVASLSGNAVGGPNQTEVTLTAPGGRLLWRAPEKVQVHPLVDK